MVEFALKSPSHLLDVFSSDDIKAFIDDLGLVPSCLVSDELLDSYRRFLKAELSLDCDSSVESQIRAELVADRLLSFSRRNNNRLKVWRRSQSLYPQLVIQGFE